VALILLALSLGVLGVGKVLKLFVPGYSLVIHSGYWISLLVFWAAWMVMESSESFLALKDPRKEGWTWAAVVALVYGAALVLKLTTMGEGGLTLYAGDLGLSVLFLGGIILARSVQARFWLLLASIVLSLGLAAEGLNILLDRSYYDRPPQVMASLGREGRMFFSPIQMKEAGRLQGGSLAEAYEIAKQKLYPDWPLVFGKELAPFYNTLQLQETSEWTEKPFRYSLRLSREALDYLDVRYVFGKTRFKDMHDRGVTLMARPPIEVEVSENPSPLPKWFSVERAVAAGPSLEDDLQKADQEGLDLAKACFVSDVSKAGVYAKRQVSVQTHWPNRLTFTAEGKGKALVVSSESAYPGWKAYVEGKEKPLERVNHAFRGLVLEEGETRAVLQFEPRTFRLGLFLSLLVCGLWFGLFLRRCNNSV
jgi:hypothetical protein